MYRIIFQDFQDFQDFSGLLKKILHVSCLQAGPCEAATVIRYIWMQGRPATPQARGLNLRGKEACGSRVKNLCTLRRRVSKQIHQYFKWLLFDKYSYVLKQLSTDIGPFSLRAKLVFSHLNIDEIDYKKLLLYECHFYHFQCSKQLNIFFVYLQHVPCQIYLRAHIQYFCNILLFYCEGNLPKYYIFWTLNKQIFHQK